jgi:hypothetical protein
MSKIESLLADILARKQRLDDPKAQSPEMAEALALADEYHGLLNDLRELCNPTPAQVVPAPYVVYPEPRYHPSYQITWNADVPVGSTLQIVK